PVRCRVGTLSTTEVYLPFTMAPTAWYTWLLAILSVGAASSPAAGDRSAASYHVSPTGSPSGTGSLFRPPGPEDPHTVSRQRAGPRATIDGTLLAEGAYLTFWGFEIMQSNPTTYGL